MSSAPPFLVCWDFTLWKLQKVNWEIDAKEYLASICSKFVFQEEESKEHKLHGQGRVKLIKKSSENQLINWGRGTILEGAHWSPTSNATRENFSYVMKLQSRVRGPWCDASVEEIPRDFVGKVLHPWQNEIIQVMKEEKDTRYVHVLVDLVGGVGKSFFARWCDYHEIAGWIPSYEDMKDMLQTVYGTGKRDAYIIDMPRNHKALKMWMGVEQVKNGTIIDARHKFKKLRINIPVVWVFTNQWPQRSALSDDRWKLYSVNMNQLVKVQWPAAPGFAGTEEN